MSALNRTPENTALLQPTKYVLSFSRLPDVTFFCQQANLPSVQIPQAIQQTPFVDLPRPGNTIQYSPFIITFLVDEELRSWKGIYDWMLSITDTKNFTEYKAQVYSDATVTIFSALNNPKLKYSFKDCFPTNLSSLEFDTTKSANDIMTASATFRYGYYEFAKA